MNIMVVPSWYSSSENKVHGSFFKEQFLALQRSHENIIVAYNEIWPITRILKNNGKRGINLEYEDGLKVYRYKDYNFLPKNPNMFRIFNKRMESLYKEIVKKEGKIDIIHAHSAFWGGISACYVAKKYNIPFVLTEHSSMKDSIYVRESYKKWIYDTYNKCDRLIAVGNSLKKELQNYTKNEITVIHNMVDLNTFVPIDMKKDNKKINLFSLAYLVPGKGMDSLIIAFKNAFKGENVNLTIGGDGILKEHLQSMVKELNIEDQVKFLGALSREEVSKEMNLCDGFVLASEHETFGMVYVEAMAVGKPILGTKNGGAEDIIKDYNGIIVENKNIVALEEGLKEFVHKIPYYNKDLIIRKVHENYGEERIIKKIKMIYKEIV
ncbi:MAG: glycosyltransferase family 4 protein [Clostridiales bacterium]|nr:glycosyltransferase family 4 protein [Clostridiales bacterium]